jgi:acetyl esterase/lipase
MRHETVQLSVPGADGPTELITYVPDNYSELGLDRTRPAIILCPGGGYQCLSPREDEPVALRFAGLGYAVFSLHYHVAPQARYPIPQRQLLVAIDHVRTHCERYHVDPKAIVPMGFSAGGHLAGCAATLWKEPEIVEPLGKSADAYRPDGAVLCYSVVTSGDMGHQESFKNLLGERYKELKDQVSLEKHVQPDTPPMFLWHTVDDTTVPVENATLLLEALKAQDIEVECHLYPHGSHAQSLADRTVYHPDQLWQLSVTCSTWVERCDAWLQRMFMPDPKLTGAKVRAPSPETSFF